MNAIRACVAAALFAAAGTVSADVILSNLPGASSGTGTNLGLGTDLADRTKAVGLTTGAQSLEFESMVALISNIGADADLIGGIYSSTGGNPGSLLASFSAVTVASGTSAQEIAMTVAGGFTLQANTSYWFLLDGPSVSNSLLWDSLAPNVAPSPTGVTFDGYRFSSNGGGTWGSSSIFNGVTINVVPAPGAVGLLGMAGLAATRRRR